MSKQQGKVSQLLLDRLEGIAKGEDEFDASNARSALLLLKKLKRRDEYENSKTKPDEAGFYNSYFVTPTENKRLHVIRDGVELVEYFDGDWWHGPHNNLGSTLKPEKWKYAK